MADESLENGADAGNEAENNAAQAAADENLNQENANQQASPDAGSELSEEQKAEQTADAQAQHDKNGTWPEDTPKWVKERINKSTRKFYNEKQRADTAEAETTRLREENERLKNSPAELGDKPKMDDFDSEEEYMDKLTDWKMDKRDQDNATQSQENKTKNTQQEAEQEFNRKMDTMLDKGQEKHDDFMVKVQNVPGNIFRQDVVAAITEADNSDDVAYFLADNLAEAAKIAEMQPTQRAIALGQISARLSATTTQKLSNAPEPIKAGGSKANGPVDESKLSDAEFFAKRDAARMAADR